MKNILTILALIVFTLNVSADNTGDRNKNSKITPKAELKDNKSFEVGGLKACTAEADEEDAISEFDLDETSSTLDIEPLIESLEDSQLDNSNEFSVLEINPVTEEIEDSVTTTINTIEPLTENLEDSEIALF